MSAHLLVFLLSATTATMVLAQASALEVSLTGIQHDRGSLRVGLYSEPKTFRKEAQAVAIQQVPASAGTVTVSFGALPPGRYAIMAYHDEDGNGELNRRFGMFPTEGYGLSNNPTVSGPPAFADSAFEVAAGAGTTRISIDLRY
ncbi:MAG TPA: DUF2141 domain-containing protein [Thauera sp.]|uniref:DUF2141 domain-containing protein n=1 Tax=Thauera sp. 28 TaxID=303682 RepID=UPI0002CF53DE|nr:DUF2141 domain-containing protein [Thauera sp. 28]ENO94720.1 hypothetical protein C662_00785 [Thauera sp. 28]HAG75749.1 DUF2141 domain-containing protein [Thauera sp.]HAY08684.1 DUF2141 domain-containing protein [Thauera sp.]HRJ25498.1 DUF2141 domain-containing protein [Thauera sp.]